MFCFDYNGVTQGDGSILKFLGSFQKLFRFDRQEKKQDSAVLHYDFYLKTFMALPETSNRFNATSFLVFRLAIINARRAREISQFSPSNISHSVFGIARMREKARARNCSHISRLANARSRKYSHFEMLA